MHRLVRMFWVSNTVSSEEVVSITLQLLLHMLLLFSHSFMSNSLKPLDCNEPVSSILHCLPEFAQNSCPLNQWCYVIHILLKVKVKSHSCVRLFETPWTVAHQAPPSMKFSRQEYWSGLPFPSLGTYSYVAHTLKFSLSLYVCILSHSCLTLYDPLDCSPPGSSVHGIFQARILKWVSISYSRGSSWPRNQAHISCVSCIGSKILYHWATWEAPLLP